jgi:D-serine deaminase-like pyridoxal phosphate-dependent protein
MTFSRFPFTIPIMMQDVPYTPALVIDEQAVERNLKRLADYTKPHGIGIRPHTKTHKSIRMAKRQLHYGAVGLTVAKVGEAEVMAQAGDDLLLAYPALDPARTGRVAELAKSKTIRLALDSLTSAQALGAAAASAGSTLGVLVDLDIGFHRTGLQSPAAALELAQQVSKIKGLRLDGLFFYPGHVFLKNPADVPAQLKPIADLLQQTIDLWAKNGLQAKIVSGGSTPTAYFSHLIPQQTEIRPGTYIYNDTNCLAVQCCKLEDCAARITCTVISDAVPGKCVLDAGTKTFTSDRNGINPDSGSGYIVEYPQAKIVRCSEEHGEVDLSKCDRHPKLGERVTVIPNHICPVVNLQDVVFLRHADGALEKMPVDARGKLS